MNMIKATFDRGVFVPEKKPRIAQGQLVYLSVSRVPPLSAEENPSPSGDPYFLVPENLQAIREGLEQIKRGEGKTYTKEELRIRMGL
jgi:hypothetical protein